MLFFINPFALNLLSKTVAKSRSGQEFSQSKIQNPDPVSLVAPVRREGLGKGTDQNHHFLRIRRTTVSPFSMKILNE